MITKSIGTTARTAIAAAVTLGVLGSGAVLAADASASGGGGVRTNGACSASSVWKLKAKNDDGALEVEFEVDSNVVGQTWKWRLTDNGKNVGRGTSVTVAPSGSFTVERTIANRTGTDTIGFVARNASPRETCTGSLSI